MQKILLPLLVLPLLCVGMVKGQIRYDNIANSELVPKDEENSTSNYSLKIVFFRPIYQEDFLSITHHYLVVLQYM